jgi:hypothetical protein
VEEDYEAAKNIAIYLQTTGKTAGCGARIEKDEATSTVS